MDINYSEELIQFVCHMNVIAYEGSVSHVGRINYTMAENIISS